MTVNVLFAGVAVADLDVAVEWYQRLLMRGRGIEVGEVETIAPGVRKTEISDPEGNRVGFGEAVSSAG